MLDNLQLCTNHTQSFPICISHSSVKSGALLYFPPEIFYRGKRWEDLLSNLLRISLLLLSSFFEALCLGAKHLSKYLTCFQHSLARTHSLGSILGVFPLQLNFANWYLFFHPLSLPQSPARGRGGDISLSLSLHFWNPARNFLPKARERKEEKRLLGLGSPSFSLSHSLLVPLCVLLLYCVESLDQRIQSTA